MIRFDINKLSVEHVKLKAITTALGGSVSILDEQASAVAGKDVFERVPMPMAVARIFIKKHDSKYVVPIPCAVTYYDGHAVAIESHPEGARAKKTHIGLDGQEVEWYSESEKNIDSIIPALTKTGDWFVDGTFIYRFNDSERVNMSTDGKFRSIPVDTINMTRMESPVFVAERSCLAFYVDREHFAVSPPIWKNLMSVGTRQLDKSDDDSSDDESVGSAEVAIGQFDRIDQYLSVNLGFALKAASELIDVFGYDSIEPLGLADLMIQLRTVNLPNMPRELKRSYDTGMKFTHAVAWLLGLLSRTETLESYKVLRSLLKYLTTKGVYRKTAFAEGAIFRENMSLNNIKLMTIEEALRNTGTIPNDISISSLTYKTSTDRDVSTVGPLYGAE